MREVLRDVVVVRGTRQIEDESDWACRWLKFAESLPGVGEMPVAEPYDADDWIQWIDRAVESFTRRHEMLNVYKKAVVAGGVPT